MRNTDGRRLYEAARHYWLPIAYADTVGATPVTATALGTDLIAVRMNGEARVFDAACPHRGAPLAAACIQNERLVCAYHAWEFNAEGVSEIIPQRPELSGVLKAQLRSYRSIEKNGMVWVSLTGNPVAPILDFPEWDDATFRKLQYHDLTWNCSAQRRVENFVDLPHLAILHDGYIGTITAPEVHDHEAWREDNTLRATVPFIAPPDIDIQTEFDMGAMRDLTKQFTIGMPFSVRFYDELADGAAFVLYLGCLPISPERTRCFMYTAINFGSPADDERFMKHNDIVIIDQDMPIVEGQRPIVPSLDLSAEMYMKEADKITLEYRKWLIEIADEHAPAT